MTQQPGGPPPIPPSPPPIPPSPPPAAPLVPSPLPAEVLPPGPSADDKSMAMLARLLGILVGFLGP